MRMTFKATMMKEWTLTDDSIIVGNKMIKLTEITDVRYTGAPTSSMKNGVVQIFIGNKFHTLAFPYKQCTEGDQAAKYIMEHYGSQEKQALNKAMQELEKQEFRMRCNVCGKIFCYTMDDLRRNVANAKSAQRSATMGVLNAIGGTELGMHANISASDRYLDRIVDYSKCPSCHSSNVSLIKDGEETASPVVPTAAISAADELKKFKELLDMGVITQEEFDAKKKQLLGL